MDIEKSALELKSAGNKSFGAGHLSEAYDKYSEVIMLLSNVALKGNEELESICATSYCNRAACRLKRASEEDKMVEAENVVKDCSAALELRPNLVKALFRRAQAYVMLKDKESLALKDLTFLLHLDPNNGDAIALTRQVRKLVSTHSTTSSEAARLLKLISDSDITTSASASKSKVDKVDSFLRALMSLCSDDNSHARDFARNNGIRIVNVVIQSSLGKESNEKLIATSLMVLCAACNHSEFVLTNVDATKGPSDALTENGKLNFCALTCMVDEKYGVEISQAALTLCVRIIKGLPLMAEEGRPPEPPKPDKSPLREGDSRVEELPSDEDLPQSEPSTDASMQPFLGSYGTTMLLGAILRMLSLKKELEKKTELFTFAADALLALTSDCADYFTPDQSVDTRMEGLEERKARLGKLHVIRVRRSRNCILCIKTGVLDHIVESLDHEDALVRARALACFGRVVVGIDNQIEIQNASQGKKKGKNSKEDEDDDIIVKEYMKKFMYGCINGESDIQLPSITDIRLRASVTAALLTTKPDVGVWALHLPQGMRQTMFLVSTENVRCQDIAAEVMCLVSAAEGGAELLQPALEAEVLQKLLKASNPSTRAAAASCITKLSIKAKALSDDSPEVAQVLNAAFDVIKASNMANQLKSEKNDGPEKQISSHVKSFTNMTPSFADSSKNAASLASVERAIEVIAAMIGKTTLKEEISHGSYRVSKGSLELLSKLELDARSTAAYGLAHVLAAVTVTNHELRAKALAEKDMTVEQYEKLQEIQRIKTKDEKGNPIEEKKEDHDPDTDKLCRLRIQRVVAAGGIPCLSRLLSFGSTQTRDTAARALRQICIEESVRGQFIQQGALRTCSDVISSEKSSSSKDDAKETSGLLSPEARRESAHAIAKALVTTNPSLLAEHMRVGAIQPLVGLAKDVDSSTLQQFEALLSITNIVSCGELEATRFVKEKGIHSVHYLMFSDNMMVRRAACEVFCNISLEEGVLKILRQAEKIRLWVGFCEDWNNESDEEQSFLIARACCGTLAVACQDDEVSKALISENIGTAACKMLESGNVELIHRTLALIQGMVETYSESSNHLLSSGIVPAIAAASKTVDSIPDLVSLAKSTANALSKSLKACTEKE